MSGLDLGEELWAAEVPVLDSIVVGIAGSILEHGGNVGRGGKSEHSGNASRGRIELCGEMEPIAPFSSD